MNPESMTYDELFKYIIDPYLNSMSSEDLTTRALTVLYDKTQEKIESEIYQVEKTLDEDTVRNLELEVTKLERQVKEIPRLEDENRKLKQQVKELLERIYGE